MVLRENVTQINIKCVFWSNYSCDMGGKSQTKVGTQGWERARKGENKESGVCSILLSEKGSLFAEEGSVHSENVKSAEVLAL